MKINLPQKRPFPLCIDMMLFIFGNGLRLIEILLWLLFRIARKDLHRGLHIRPV